MQQENTNLELHIQYILIKGGITILSCKGYGTTVTIPTGINGYPVKRIGAYSFSDPGKGLNMLSQNTEILTKKIPGIKVPGSQEEYIYGHRLQEITLPESIEIIDEYAFYNCKELATVNMPGGRIQIENGAFMNCEKLTLINIQAAPEDLTSAKGILTELTSELCLTFTGKDEKGVFIFPEYYEDSIENISARVFQDLLYGAGYRYRQCFEQGRLNVMAYDMVYQSAEIQIVHETALNIAFLRLQYPYKLNDSMKKQYLDFITLHIEKAVKLMITQDNTKGLIFLAGLGVMTEQNFSDAQEEAVRTERRECAGILLQERLHYYPPREKKFEL